MPTCLVLLVAPWGSDLEATFPRLVLCVWRPPLGVHVHTSSSALAYRLEVQWL